MIHVQLVVSRRNSFRCKQSFSLCTWLTKLSQLNKYMPTKEVCYYIASYSLYIPLCASFLSQLLLKALNNIKKGDRQIRFYIHQKLICFAQKATANHKDSATVTHNMVFRPESNEVRT